MNSIIKQLNEAFSAKTVTFKQLDACRWIEDEYKLEMKRLANSNKLLKNNWRMIKSFLNERICILNTIVSSGEPEDFMEHRALLVAYQNTLKEMKGLENTEALNNN